MTETQKAELQRTRENYEAALKALAANERVYKQAQVDAQKALQEYNAHILGETK